MSCYNHSITCVSVHFLSSFPVTPDAQVFFESEDNGSETESEDDANITKLEDVAESETENVDNANIPELLKT